MEVTNIEIFAIITTVLSVVFAAYNKTINWVFSIASAIAYGIIFKDDGKYFNMVLQIIFFVQSVFGLFSWEVVNTSIVKIDQHQKYKIVGFLILLPFLYLVFDNFDVIKRLDMITAIGSVIATYYLGKRMTANWAMWAYVDVFLVVMFILSNMYASAIMYFGFMIVSLYTIYRWEKLK